MYDINPLTSRNDFFFCCLSETEQINTKILLWLLILSQKLIKMTLAVWISFFKENCYSKGFSQLLRPPSVWPPVSGDVLPWPPVSGDVLPWPPVSGDVLPWPPVSGDVLLWPPVSGGVTMATSKW